MYEFLYLVVALVNKKQRLITLAVLICLVVVFIYTDETKTSQSTQLCKKKRI